MQGKLNGIGDRKQAEHIMKREMPVIKEIAQKTVEEKGYQYSCNVVYHEREFPIKMYGDLTFPAGKYEALDVLLGDAKGKNWWCVMFPSLCFVEGSYCVVPDSSKAKLKNVLTQDEYKSISSKKTCKVSYKFKLFEWTKKRKGTAYKR
jgi:stage II sporulation protein R